MSSSQTTQAVDNAITSRRSIRAFLPKPVSLDDVNAILEVAARAPSGTNMQPWKVHVLTGSAIKDLTSAIFTAYMDPDYKTDSVYKYYPDVFPEPYLSRRRKVGWDLYGLLGIGREDKDKMKAQLARNYTFFDAPVGLMFSIDSRLEIGSWLDYGMFLENIMIAARGRGLDTCPQAAFANFHVAIKKNLGIPEDDIVVCGMALGYADPDAIENTLVTERAGLDDFVTYHGD